MTSPVDLLESQRGSHRRSTRSKCAVVVVNYGSHALLSKNLLPLASEDLDLDIIVVDNFTNDAERRAASDMAESYGWAFIPETRNLGFGAAVNRGAEQAIERGAQQLLLLNPDASIGRRALGRLQECVDRDPMLMVSPRILTPDGRIWFDGAVVDLEVGVIRPQRAARGCTAEMPWLSGACLLLSAKLWNDLGGIDDRYFLYWEDVDLSYRAQQAGGRLCVVREAVAIHAQGGTQQTCSPQAKSREYYYFMTRNRLLFAQRHLTNRQRVAWTARAPKYAWDVVLHGGRRQLAHSLSPIWMVARGTWEGICARDHSVGGGGAAEHETGRIVVLQSVPTIKPTTNPYNVLLVRALEDIEGIDVRMFGWREALFRHQDVFHAHWPEALISRRGFAKTMIRRALFGILLIKWKMAGTTVVRTVHNIGLPSDISVVERLLLIGLERMTIGRIVLNPFTQMDPTRGPVQIVPHGNYVPWFERYEIPSPQPGRIAFFGAIRRYKGVETLVHEFRGVRRNDLTLVVAGRPSSSVLIDDLTAAAAGDPRISIDFHFLDTAALVRHVGMAELIVLPHTDMHNSGSAIAALSLNRPVLMQNNEVNRWLRSEVGAGWIYLYDGQITADVLSLAVDGLRQHPPEGVPNLSARDWETAAMRHVTLYRESIIAARTRPGRAHTGRSPGPLQDTGLSIRRLISHDGRLSNMNASSLMRGPRVHS